MSYETLRADADWTSAHPWAYAVLDEGHIIRNPKSKIAQVPNYTNQQARMVCHSRKAPQSTLRNFGLVSL